MAAHKDRLITAAELLGMTPDDLMTALDRDSYAVSDAVALHLPTDDSGYGWESWEEDDERPGVYILTISDPAGEECAVIVHRTCDGRYPLDGPTAEAKVRRAERIVAALNRDAR